MPTTDSIVVITALVLGVIPALLTTVVVQNTRMAGWHWSIRTLIVISAWGAATYGAVDLEASEEMTSDFYGEAFRIAAADCRMQRTVDGVLSDGRLSRGDMRLIDRTKERIALDDARRRARRERPVPCAVRSAADGMKTAQGPRPSAE